MKGCLHVVRGMEKKLTLPGPSITIKADGTIWYSGSPLLGITDAEEKSRISTLVKAKKYNQIPTSYFTRFGENPNGLWAGTDEEWAKHPVKVAHDKAEADKSAKQAKMITIYLSSRGWGDYGSLDWYGDITRPDAEILAECKHLLATGHDVDQPNQSDEEILSKIKAARESWRTAPERKAAREKAEAEDIKRKIETGYCFACDTWCHGDCGNYSNDPRVMYRKHLNEAAREANYGIND